MKFSRAVTLLLAAALLSSCGAQNTDASTEENTTAPQATEEVTTELGSLAELGKQDFGGAEFSILGREYAKLGTLPSIEFVVEEENGDLINDTIFKRNQIVEDQFNVVIKATQCAQGQANTVIEQSQMAGDGEYDLVWAHVNDMSTMVQKDLLSDYNGMPYIDITKPWWNQLATDSLTVNGKCFLQMNYIPFTGVMLSHCLYFNKATAEDYSLENIYELVRGDKWTFDTFASLAKKVSEDVDGNNVFDDNDSYGLICSHGTTGGAMSIAMGTKVLKIAGDGSFELKLLSDRNQSIIEKLVALTTDGCTYMITDYKLENDLAKMFAEGKGLFYSGFLTDSYQFFRDMNDDFGLLPFPKYDEAQEHYITTVTGGTGLLGIPKVVKDPDMVGFVTEALAIESYKYVYPAIYETVFTQKLLRDDESQEMFDILMEGLEIDFGRTFKYTAYADLMPDLIVDGSTELASSCATYEADAAAHYEKMIALYYED